MKPIVNASALKAKPIWPIINEVINTPMELPNWKLPKRILLMLRPIDKTTNINKIGFCSSKATTFMFTTTFLLKGVGNYIERIVS